LSADDIAALKGTFHAFLREVLGLQAESGSNAGGGDESETGALLDLIVDMRTTAKANKDWGTADKIRDVLSAHGITIQDGKDGSSWTRG
jgi:cysteinyl-tRNA synthetase